MNEMLQRAVEAIKDSKEETFEEWLIRMRTHAMDSAAETREIAPDSWGSGYDTGYSDALEHVAAQFTLEEPKPDQSMGRVALGPNPSQPNGK